MRLNLNGLTIFFSSLGQGVPGEWQAVSGEGENCHGQTYSWSTLSTAACLSREVFGMRFTGEECHILLCHTFLCHTFRVTHFWVKHFGHSNKADKLIRYLILKEIKIQQSFFSAGDDMGWLQPDRGQEGIHGSCPNHVGRPGPVQHCHRLVQALRDIVACQLTSKRTT